MATIGPSDRIDKSVKTVGFCSKRFSTEECFVEIGHSGKSNCIVKCKPTADDKYDIYLPAEIRSKYGFENGISVTATKVEKPTNLAFIAVKLEVRPGKQLAEFDKYADVLRYGVVQPNMKINFVSAVATIICETLGYVDETTQIFPAEQPQSTGSLELVHNIDFESIGIGGLTYHLQELTKRVFVSRMISEKTRKALGMKHHKGVVLYGPPGNGKTVLARKMGEITGVKASNIQVVNGPSLLSKYVGEGEENIRKLFGRARDLPDEIHIIIFDEFDALASSRSGGSDSHNDKLVGQLLTMMDGIEEQTNVIVFALTNRLDMIDPALLRPGRFGLHLYIPNPNQEARFEILKVHNNNILSDEELRVLASKTEGFSGAGLEDLIAKTVQDCVGLQIDFANIKESIAKIETATITLKDFEKTLDKIESKIKTKSIHTDHVNQSILNNLVNRMSYMLNPENSHENDGILALTNAKPQHCRIYLEELQHMLGKKYGNITCSILSARDLIHQHDSQKVKSILSIFDNNRVVLIDNFDMVCEYMGSYNKNILHAIKVAISQSTSIVLLTCSDEIRVQGCLMIPELPCINI
jgi:ATP-dependent 26S proteasome regulatory subunit/bifunctional DNA-binding transcriptional regulator/antitoxin component of YhaV-PrlF toxin-antitoxin module